MRDRTAFDCILQCLTGLAAINGRPGDFPMLTGAYIVDTVAALIATIGALAALQQREQTGVGQLVDVAMLDSALTLLGPVIPVAAATGEEPSWPATPIARRHRPTRTAPATAGCTSTPAPTRSSTASPAPWGATRSSSSSGSRTSSRGSRTGRRSTPSSAAGWRSGRSRRWRPSWPRRAYPASRVNSVVQAVNDAELQIRDRLVEVVGSNGVTIPALAFARPPQRLADGVRHGVPSRDDGSAHGDRDRRHARHRPGLRRAAHGRRVLGGVRRTRS